MIQSIELSSKVLIFQMSVNDEVKWINKKIYITKNVKLIFKEYFQARFLLVDFLCLNNIKSILNGSYSDYFHK